MKNITLEPLEVGYNVYFLTMMGLFAATPKNKTR